MAEKFDGYVNAFLGHGLRSRDPFASYRYGMDVFNPLVDYRQADALFTSNGLANRIITLPATDALRCGFEIESGEKMSEEMEHKLESTLEDINTNQKMELALTWDRLFGGAVILVIADDGGRLEEPLNMDRIRRVEKLEVYSPEEVSFTSAMLYDNPADPNYGRPQYYNIIGLWGNAFVVHESRLLMFYGGDISNYYRRMRNGWGGSVYEQIRTEMLHYTGGQDLAYQALSRLSQGILKLENLTDVLSREGGDLAVQKRLQIIDMARHMMNTIAIDTLDDYDLKNISLNGIKEVIEGFQMALCSATGIPSTLLFGRSPNGMNATGKSDLENYYNLVENYQQHTLRNPLMRLIEIVAACSDYGIQLPQTWNIEFEPLWNESDKEKAETKKLKADAEKSKTDSINTLVQSQVLSVDEARELLARDDKYAEVIDLSLDATMRTPVE